jgi:hypothetical protein
MNLVMPALAAALAIVPAAAQEHKPLPKDSVRVFVPGCSKGRVFTAGHPTEDQTGGAAVPEGTHLRMNGPKTMMAEIKGHEGSRIEITGLIKKGQVAQPGVAIGGGVRVMPGGMSGGGLSPSPGGYMLAIDVEGWRSVAGECPTR